MLYRHSGEVGKDVANKASMMRRNVLRAAGSLLLVAMYGCASQRARPAVGYSLTTVEVSSILLSVDGKKLVVLTEDRHFVFDVPANLVAALNSNYHQRMTAEIGIVDVQPNADAYVRVVLTMPAGSEEDMKALMPIGFRQKFGDRSKWELQPEALRGVAYKANGALPPATSMRLNRTYRVTVSEKGANRGYSDLPSPIRATAGGALAIALAPLVIIALPIVVLAVMPRGVGVGPR